MKDEVARPGAGARAPGRRLVVVEAAGRGVEAELAHQVAAEAGGEGEAVRRIDLHRVGVRLGGDDLLRRLRDAVGADRADRDQAGVVGGAEQEAAAAVGRDPAHAGRQRRLADSSGGRRRGRWPGSGRERAPLRIEACRTRRSGETASGITRPPQAKRCELAQRPSAPRRERQDGDVVAVGVGDVDDGMRGRRRRRSGALHRLDRFGRAGVRDRAQVRRADQLRVLLQHAGQALGARAAASAARRRASSASSTRQLERARARRRCGCGRRRGPARSGRRAPPRARCSRPSCRASRPRSGRR